jgi:hypothetical protein
MPAIDYFADPLTTECFDRTPEQRAERTAVVLSFLNKGQTTKEADASANAVMFVNFLSSINEIITERIQEQLDQAHSVSTLDIEPIRAGVVDELAQLHQTMPLHGLERLVKEVPHD